MPETFVSQYVNSTEVCSLIAKGEDPSPVNLREALTLVVISKTLAVGTDIGYLVRSCSNSQV